MPGYTVGILPQEPALDEGKTVLGTVEEGAAGTNALIERYNAIAERMAADYSDDLLAEMGRLQAQLDQRDAWDLDSRIAQAMDALRCPPPEAGVSVLSGGERRRVALCRLLLSQPDLLLLDEPTNPPGRRRASPGWKSTWAHTRARWWPSPTTGTSSTM